MILTGDFNADEGSAPYQALFSAADGAPSPLRDAYRLAHPQRADGEGTFSSFRAGPSSSGRIDWIGVSAGWQVRSSEIDRTTHEGRGLSDHFPVIAELQPAAP